MSDYISRHAAIEAIRGCTEYYHNNMPTMIDKASAQTELMMLPTADVRENVKSEKVISGGSADSDGVTLWFRCSACDGSVDISDNFCKHCGADMRGES